MVTIPGPPYDEWTVSTTDMTEEQATRAAAWIETEFDDVHASPVDPAAFYSLHLDRWTTELLRDALVSLSKQGGDVAALLEDVEDWLTTRAEPYPEGYASADIYKPVNQ